jgi:hypothetical protein
MQVLLLIACVCALNLFSEQFADSAKRVMTRARLNSALVPDRVLVKRLQAEIERLKRMIMAQTGSGSADGGSAAMVRLSFVLVWCKRCCVQFLVPLTGGAVYCPS